MSYDYIANFSGEERWEVMKMVLASGKYEDVLSMLDDGYRVTGLLLECLYRLGQRGIIDQILESSYRFESNACDFLTMYTCSSSINALNKNLSERREAKRTREREEKLRKEETERQKQEAEKKHREDVFESLLQSGLTSKLMEAAHQDKSWKKVIEKYGVEAVYEAVKDTAIYLNDVRRVLPFGFLYEKGDFNTLWQEYQCHISELPDDKICDWVNSIVKYRGGIAALYALENKEIDRALVRLGFINFFFNDAEKGCRRLAKVKLLTKDDLKNLYQSNSHSVIRFIRHHGTFKQKAALFLGMFRK